jgi:GDP-L-fucose synthase
MEFRGKTVLVTGANGLVGHPTVKKCLEEGVSTIYAVDLKFSEELTKLAETDDRLKLIQTDLTYLHNCENLFKGSVIDIVLHIAGVKGSPLRSSTMPADYLFPMLMFNTNMIKAAFDAKVGWFVYLSSVGVYKPADIMNEEDTWNREETWASTPSKNDWHPGWSKRMGELTLDSLKVQYGWDNWTVLRPSNIYGTHDNFAPDATVISTNIWKLFNVEGDEMVCWGDGSPRRDFVFGDDVAQATIDVVKKEVRDVINFGCGDAVTIKETIETIVEQYKNITGKTKRIVWDTTKMNGDAIRCLGSHKQKKYDILPRTNLADGIKETIKVYMHNNNIL